MLSLPYAHGSNQTIRFENIIDVFNPLKNPYMFPTSTGTFADLKWMLERIFTRENIEQHPELLGGDTTNSLWFNSYEVYIKTQRLVVPNIPDDKLWLLAFSVFNETISNDMSIYYYDSMGVAGTGPYYLSGTWDAIYPKANDPQTARKLLNKLEKIENDFNSNLEKRFNVKKNCFHYNRFVRSLTWMYFELPYVRDSMTRSDDPRYTASQIANKLRETPECDLSFSDSSYQVEFRQFISNTNRSALYSILNYTTNPCRLLKWPRTAKNEHKPVLYGVELEIATNYSIQELIDAQKDLFFIGKADGSISGSGRTKVELVTVPMSLRAHKKDWAHWFRNLDYTQFDCTTQTNNGQHIHIDKTAFLNNKHRDAFIWFFTNPCNKDFITTLSERSNISMQQFAPLPSFSSNQTLIQCYRNIYRNVAGFRGTINVSSNKPTIEVRLFRGIVSYASILKNLELVDAVFHFTQNLNFQQITLAGFFNWLNSLPPNRYKVLRKYFSLMRKVDEMVLAASVIQTVYNINEPSKVVDLVNKSGLPLSNSIVSILNKGRNRTYVFNRKTGLIELDQSKKSKVAFMDRQLESIYTRDVA
jgi:hypothetical protein